jgi:hypothetical protein
MRSHRDRDTLRHPLIGAAIGLPTKNQASAGRHGPCAQKPGRQEAKDEYIYSAGYRHGTVSSGARHNKAAQTYRRFRPLSHLRPAVVLIELEGPNRPHIRRADEGNDSSGTRYTGKQIRRQNRRPVVGY